MKIIKELTEEVQVLTEEKDGKKNYFIEGIFLQSNVVNRNKRLYPEEILTKEVNRYIAEKVEKGRAFGELGHPNGPNINMERVSHVIKSIKKDGTNFIGRAAIIDEGYGKIVRGIIDQGAQVGVSSRALGSLKPNSNGIMEVHDLMLATAGDIVADPSAPDAYVNSIMEDQEWVFAGGQWVQQFVDEEKKLINKAAASIDKVRLEEEALASFQRFLSKL